MIKPKAFIFDLDGVLTDTALYHFLAWKKISDELSLKFNEEDNERLKGVSRLESFEIILEINNKSKKYSEIEKNFYINKKNDYYLELINQIKPSDVLPNIINFLEDSKKENIKLAVASASKNAMKVLTLLEILHYFDFVADASKIQNSKPAPDVFNVCAEFLDVSQKDCVGFEDAQAGIEAIKSANMFSVGINVSVTSVSPDLILKSTNELSVNKVFEAFEKFYK